MEEYFSITDIQRLAQSRMKPDLLAYLESWAWTWSTHSGNCTAFSRDVIVPQPLACSHSDTTTTTHIAGVTDAISSVFVAPTAWHKLFHSQWELATLIGAHAQKALMIISSFSQTSWAEFISGTEWSVDPTFYQMLMIQDEWLMREKIHEAQNAGCSAIVITVDAPNWCTACRPHAGKDRVDIDNMPLLPRRENDGVSTLWGYLQKYTNQWTYDWAYISRIVSSSPLPVYLKWILHPEDVEKAKSAWAQGIIVSNHGGRQMDGVISSYDALKRMQDTNQWDLSVLMDWGVRSGIDILKALIAWADAVGIGRPIHYGLFLDGQKGVSNVLGILQQELQTALRLAWFNNVSDAHTNGGNRVVTL